MWKVENNLFKTSVAWNNYFSPGAVLAVQECQKRHGKDGGGQFYQIFVFPIVH